MKITAFFYAMHFINEIAKAEEVILIGCWLGSG